MLQKKEQEKEKRRKEKEKETGRDREGEEGHMFRCERVCGGMRECEYK